MLTVLLALIGLQAAPALSDAPPFAITPFIWSSQAFSPNADGVDDTIGDSACLSANAHVDVYVRPTGGTDIRDLQVGVSHPSGCSVVWSWDGRDGANVAVADGPYQVVVHGVDQLGAESTLVYDTAVDNAPVASVTVPAANATVSGTAVPYTITPATGRTLDSVFITGSEATAQLDGTWTGDFDSTVALNGLQTFTWQVQYADAFGYPHFANVTRQVNVANALALVPAVFWTSTAFSPNNDGFEDTLTGGYCASVDTTVGVTVRHTGGAQVRVLDAAKDVPASAGSCFQNGTSAWTWDGKDTGGTTVPDGNYQVVVTTQPVSGTPVTLVFDLAVDTAPVALLTQPANNATVSGAAVPWTMTPAPGRTLDYVYFANTGVAGSLQEDGSWTGTFDSRSMANGPTDFTWGVYYRDDLGAYHVGLPVVGHVTVANIGVLTASLFWESRAFSPNGDGYEDTISSAFCSSTDTTVDVSVRHTGGATVKQLATGSAITAHAGSCHEANGATVWNWDGTATGGAFVPDGSYEVVVTTTSGPAATLVFPTAVDTAPVASVTTPAANATVSGIAVPWVVTPATGRTLDVVQFATSGISGTAQGDGTWTGTFDSTLFANGARSLTWNIYYRDGLGALHSVLPITRSVVIGNVVALTKSVLWTSQAFSPNGDGVEDTIGGGYCAWRHGRRRHRPAHRGRDRARSRHGQAGPRAQRPVRGALRRIGVVDLGRSRDRWGARGKRALPGRGHHAASQRATEHPHLRHRR